MRWLAVPAAALTAWFLPVPGSDGIYDWLTAWAAVHSDPYLPLDELAAMHGISWPSHAAHPRLPGALLLQLPLLAVPISWAADFGQAVSAASLAAAAVIARPVWWTYPLVFLPAANAVWYGQTSSTVTLLIAVWAMRRSGLALAAATTLRLWPWFIGLALFVSGRRREALVAGGWFLGLNAFGLLLPGVDVGRMVVGFESAAVVHVGSAINLGRYVPVWAGVGLAVGVLWAVRRADWRFVLVGGLGVSPVVWLHYLTVLAVPIEKAPRLPVRGTEGL